MQEAKMTPEMVDNILNEWRDGGANAAADNPTELEVMASIEKSRVARQFFDYAINEAIEIQNKGGNVVKRIHKIFCAGVLLGADLHKRAIESSQLEVMFYNQPSGAIEPCQKSQQQQLPNKPISHRLYDMGRRLFCRKG